MVEYALIILAQLVKQSKLVVDELLNSDAVGACMASFHEYDSTCKIRTLQLIVALACSHRKQDLQAAFCEAHGACGSRLASFAVDLTPTMSGGCPQVCTRWWRA